MRFHPNSSSPSSLAAASSTVQTERNSPSLVQRTAHEVGERLWLNGALLLHRVEVDPLPQLVAHGNRVGSESRQSKVGTLCCCEDLLRVQKTTNEGDSSAAELELESERRRAHLFKVAGNGESLVSETKVAGDGDAAFADHCDTAALLASNHRERPRQRRHLLVLKRTVKLQRAVHGSHQLHETRLTPLSSMIDCRRRYEVSSALSSGGDGGSCSLPWRAKGGLGEVQKIERSSENRVVVLYEPRVERKREQVEGRKQETRGLGRARSSSLRSGIKRQLSYSEALRTTNMSTQNS